PHCAVPHGCRAQDVGVTRDSGAWPLLLPGSRAGFQGARRSRARAHRHSAPGGGRRHDVRLPAAGMGGGAEPARPSGYRTLRRRAGGVRREALRDRADWLRLAATAELARRAGTAVDRRVLRRRRADAVGDGVRELRRRRAWQRPRRMKVRPTGALVHVGLPAGAYRWRTMRRTRTTDPGSSRISGSPVTMGSLAWRAVATANASA